MATKKRKEDDEPGSDKKRRKSGAAANGAELHGATSAAEVQRPIVRSDIRSVYWFKNAECSHNPPTGNRTTWTT